MLDKLPDHINQDASYQPKSSPTVQLTHFSVLLTTPPHVTQSTRLQLYHHLVHKLKALELFSAFISGITILQTADQLLRRYHLSTGMGTFTVHLIKLLHGVHW